jgi:oligopeptide/dipeptide ABC transporter ATP-binding protein
MAAALLTVEDLSVAFRGDRSEKRVLDHVGFTVAPGEIFGIVGESGSGKSVTALAIMRLLGAQGRIVSGQVVLDGTDLVRLDERAMLGVRGAKIGMIFQEPMTSLNPLLTVGFQVAEVLRAHLRMSSADAHDRAVQMLDRVGIPDAARRAADYPHQLSGGMRQRVMIALAMACRPRLLIADEPTTALDVTIQAQILDLMRELRRDEGSAVLLITHDMGVIARMADRVLVMYAGEVVESAPVAELFARPAHPYTRLLLASVPPVRHRVRRLPMIAGTMPPPGADLRGCRFAQRCPDALPLCRAEKPAYEAVGPARHARCWRAGEFLTGAAPALAELSA